MLFNKTTANKNSQIRKYTAVFGSLFANMHIIRHSNINEEYVQVPIKYGAGFLRNKADKDLSHTRVGLVLPAMSFELADVAQDGTRRTAPYIRHSAGYSEQPKAFVEDSVRTPIPHDITFRLSIRTKNIEDALLIFEQIVGAFNPSVSVTVSDNEGVAIERDIVIQLEPGYTYSDNYEDSMDSSRFVEFELTFTLKGYLYHKPKSTPIVLETSMALLNPFGDPMIDNGKVSSMGAAASSSQVDDYVDSSSTVGILESLTGITKE